MNQERGLVTLNVQYYTLQSSNSRHLIGQRCLLRAARVRHASQNVFRIFPIPNELFVKKKERKSPTTIQKCTRENHLCCKFSLAPRTAFTFDRFWLFFLCSQWMFSFHAHCWCGGHSCFVPPLVKKKKKCKFAVHFLGLCKYGEYVHYLTLGKKITDNNGFWDYVLHSPSSKTPKIAVGCWKNDEFTAVTPLFAHVLFIGTSLRHCPMTFMLFPLVRSG